MSDKDLTKSLADSIFSDETKDVAMDMSEIAIDTILDNEALKEIPFIKTVIGIYKGAQAIRDRFLLQKVAHFLLQTQRVLPEDKRKFLTKFSDNKSFYAKVMEKILLLLDRIDDKDKATIVGQLFKVTMNEGCTIEDFLKLSSIVDKAYIDDIKAYIACERFEEDEYHMAWTSYYSSEVKKNLAALGLLIEQISAKAPPIQIMLGSTEAPEYEFSYEYRPTSIGRILIEHCEPFKRFDTQ